MRDKTRMALIVNKRKIKRFLQLKNTRIFNKRNTKFRYKKIEESSIDFSKKLDFMRIVNYEM